jgi:hypothetical protein
MNIADKPYSELMKSYLGWESELLVGMLKASKVLPPERVAMMNTAALVALATSHESVARAKAMEVLRAFIEEARWRSL